MLADMDERMESPVRTSRTGSHRGIDRTSYEPAYVQLVNILREAIAAGEYQAGDQLPTEAELRAAYDLSPMTVRRAIAMLLDQGVVTTTRGRGTFVLPPRLAAASFGLDDLHELLADERVTARLLEARVVPAASRPAAHLGVAVGERVVSIRRLLERDGEPIVYQRESLIYDPRRPIVEAELGVTALRDLFQGGAGASFKHGELVVHASVLTEEEALHLDASAGGAAWVFEHLFYGYRDEPLSWGRFVCRGELLQLRTHIGVQAARGGHPGRLPGVAR
jgi:GntR family transcriptional regulator